MRKRYGLQRTIGGWAGRIGGVTCIFRRTPGGWIAHVQAVGPTAFSLAPTLRESVRRVWRRAQ